MARVFWDTNLFIYLFASHPVLGAKVESLRKRMNERGDQLFTSALTVGEILVRPVQQKRSDLESRYLQLFRSHAVSVLVFGIDAGIHYAQIRAQRNVSPPDAIQLACAATASIDLFITNDERLAKTNVPGVNFISSLEHAPF